MAATNVQAFSGDVEVASNLAVDTNTLFVDSVNNKVGIGTTNPGDNLSVMGVISAQNDATSTPQYLFRSGSSNTNSWRMRANVSDEFAGNFSIDRLDASSDKKFVIENNGNVGIGTTNPTKTLDISLDSETGSSNTVGLTIRNFSSDHTSIANGFGSRIQFVTNRGTTAEYMTPSADIKGYIYSGAGSTGDYHALDLDVYGDNSSLNRGISIVSHSSTGDPARTIMHGNVGIGITNPGFPLQVVGRHGFDEDGYWTKYHVGTGSPNGTTRIYFRDFSDSDNVSMFVDYLSSSNDASDDRIKTDEVLVENATQTLLKLKPQTYTKDIFEFDELTSEEYSNTETLTDGYVFSPTHDRWRKRRFAGRPRKETGLIIQDIWYDAPELRHIIRLADDAEPTEERPETEDIQQDPDYDSLGWGQDASHLMYQQIIPYLIKSNQELHARIQALENAS
jgi:hypothetical protein